MSSTSFPLLPVAISLSGIVILGLAFTLYLRKKSRYDGWTTTRGRMVGYKEDRGKNGKVYAPIVTFSNSGGQEVTFISRLATNNKRFDIGDGVPVRYCPLDSNRAMIDWAFDLYFIEIILGVAGVWGLVAGPLVSFLLKW